MAQPRRIDVDKWKGGPPRGATHVQSTASASVPAGHVPKYVPPPGRPTLPSAPPPAQIVAARMAELQAQKEKTEAELKALCRLQQTFIEQTSAATAGASVPTATKSAAPVPPWRLPKGSVAASMVAAAREAIASITIYII